MCRSISGFAVLLLTCVPLFAQWRNYPTPGMPRTPDGKPNLAAPAPRTADVKPDLSGVWDRENDRQFLSIGSGLKDGLPYRPGIAELVKARQQPPKVDEPLTRCLPVGAVERHTLPTLRKIVQTPGLLLILNEYNMSYRQIFTDARPQPANPKPTWDGYSSGKWDGDILVVQSIGFREANWLDAFGDPITDAAKVTERFRRINYGHLEIEVTIDDPKAYTKPWTVKLNQVLVPDDDLLEFICHEGERDIKHMLAGQEGK